MVKIILLIKKNNFLKDIKNYPNKNNMLVRDVTSEAQFNFINLLKLSRT